MGAERGENTYNRPPPPPPVLMLNELDRPKPAMLLPEAPLLSLLLLLLLLLCRVSSSDGLFAVAGYG
jgi:hypothetical protein